MKTTLQAQTEFQVNTTSANDQSAPTIAFLKDGGYIVAWQSFRPGLASDGLHENGWDIYWQRYAADGSATGAEGGLQGLYNNQIQPAISALADGGYAVAYAAQLDYDGRYSRFDYGVFTATYSVQGAATSGGEISGGRPGNQDAPSIAGLAGGGYVSTYHTDGQEDPPWTVPGVIGPAAQTTNGVDAVSVALTAGGYVIAWSLAGEILTQRFDAAHIALGQPVQVNTTVTGTQGKPALAALNDGGYVVTWQSDGQDGSGLGIYMQRFGASGAGIGGETRVNTTTAGNQSASAAVGLGDGGYAIAWVSADGSGEGIYYQRFDVQGHTAGTQTLLNSVTAGDQIDPALAASTNGGFVATWASNEGGAGWDIHAREFDLVHAAFARGPRSAHGHNDSRGAHVLAHDDAAMLTNAILIGVAPEHVSATL